MRSAMGFGWQRVRSRRAQVWVPVLAAAAVVVTARCGGPDTTGHRRTSFAVVARGLVADGVTSAGWHVTLERAAVAIGPVRWYEGPPLFGRRLRDRIQGIGLAYAHPGHYVPGEALADTTVQRVVDLTTPGGVEL